MIINYLCWINNIEKFNCFHVHSTLCCDKLYSFVYLWQHFVFIEEVLIEWTKNVLIFELLCQQLEIGVCKVLIVYQYSKTDVSGRWMHSGLTINPGSYELLRSLKWLSQRWLSYVVPLHCCNHLVLPDLHVKGQIHWDFWNQQLVPSPINYFLTFSYIYL